MGCLFSSNSRQDDVSSVEVSSPLLAELCSNNSLHNDPSAMDAKFHSLLMSLNYAKTWRRNLCSAEEYQAKLQELLDEATLEMTRLISEGRPGDCDDIVACIFTLSIASGEESFESVKIESFGREISTFGNYVLTAGQYFKPTLLCEDDDSVLKLYFFFISEAETAAVRLRYYLEHTSLVEEYFALGLLRTNGHTQVKVYGNSCPSYWTMRKDVLSDAHRRLLDEDVNANDPLSCRGAVDRKEAEAKLTNAA